MTSLGCPFDCTFCTVTMMFGRKYRMRSPESVIAELEAKKPRSVFFYDDNFAADKRRLKKLLQLMIDRGITLKWQAQVRTDVARDEELLTLMQRSGCHRLALGFESVDQATLDSYAKSQTVEDITNAIAALHRHGIHVHGMFVVGADSDTVRTAGATVAFAERYRIDSLMLNILTPGIGTKQYEMMNGDERVFERRWQFYDGQHVIFEPQNMTASQLQTGVIDGYRRFYSVGNIVRPWRACAWAPRWSACGAGCTSTAGRRTRRTGPTCRRSVSARPAPRRPRMPPSVGEGGVRVAVPPLLAAVAATERFGGRRRLLLRHVSMGAAGRRRLSAVAASWRRSSCRAPH